MTETPIFDATKSTKAKPENTLTAHDRCDRCRAQAYVKVYFTAESELMFCGHDWAEVRPNIGDVFDVIDETASINVRRDKE